MSKESKEILLVDDDLILSNLLVEYLQGEGLSVTTAYDGEEAIDRVKENHFDLIILDITMPKKDGFDVLRDIRSLSTVPVIMLTARGDELDRIVGLEMGADDYLSKPCNPRELHARIKAIMRRTSLEKEPLFRENIILSDLEIRLSDRTVRVNEKLVNLTSMEFNILHLLLRNPGQVVSKETISRKVLERKLELYDRSIDMHISNLRKKLGTYTDGSLRIKTIRSIGYMYIDNDPDA